MSNRETALKNALNRTTSLHDIEINAVGDYKSLLVLNPHSYFKVIINGFYYTAESTKDEFTAVLDILNGDIFTVNFRGVENKTASVSFKTYPLEGKHILFVKNIVNIKTLTLEYFDYFEIDTNKKITDMPSDPIFPKDGKSCDFSGINIYHLKPVTTSSLVVRNALTTSEVNAKKLLNIKTIKFGSWTFSVDSSEINSGIDVANIEYQPDNGGSSE